MEESQSPELILAVERHAERGLGTRQIFESRVCLNAERGVLESLALAVEHVVRTTKLKAKGNSKFQAPNQVISENSNQSGRNGRNGIDTSPCPLPDRCGEGAKRAARSLIRSPQHVVR
jgi:hypothetical protein